MDAPSSGPFGFERHARRRRYRRHDDDGPGVDARPMCDESSRGLCASGVRSGSRHKRDDHSLSDTGSIAVAAGRREELHSALCSSSDRDERVQGAVSIAVGLALIGGAYVWAVSVGGDAVADRFLGLLNDGVVHTFEENRGLTIRYTMTEMLAEFPFGAGLGRWGMMQTSSLAIRRCGRRRRFMRRRSQLVGCWMVAFRCCSSTSVRFLRSALRYTSRLSMHGFTLRSAAGLVATFSLCVQLTVVGLCLSGPVLPTTSSASSSGQ